MWQGTGEDNEGGRGLGERRGLETGAAGGGVGMSQRCGRDPGPTLSRAGRGKGQRNQKAQGILGAEGIISS